MTKGILPVKKTGEAGRGGRRDVTKSSSLEYGRGWYGSDEAFRAGITSALMGRRIARIEDDEATDMMQACIVD